MNESSVVRGPVAMAMTSLGTLFLHEPVVSDLADYPERSHDDPIRGVRWMLTRIASRSSGADWQEKRSRLSPEEVAILPDDEIDALLEPFLASSNPWLEHDAARGGVT